MRKVGSGDDARKSIDRGAITRAEQAVRMVLRRRGVPADSWDAIVEGVLERALNRWAPCHGELAPYAVSLVKPYLAEHYVEDTAQRGVEAPTPSAHGTAWARQRGGTAWGARHDARSLPLAGPTRRHAPMRTVLAWLDRWAVTLLFGGPGGLEIAADVIGMHLAEVLFARLAAARTGVPDPQVVRDRARAVVRDAIARHRPTPWIEDSTRTRGEWRRERQRIARAIVNDALRALGMPCARIDAARAAQRMRSWRWRKRTTARAQKSKK